MPRGIYKRKSRRRKPHYRHPKHYLAKNGDWAKKNEAVAADVFNKAFVEPTISARFHDGFKEGVAFVLERSRAD